MDTSTGQARAGIDESKRLFSPAEPSSQRSRMEGIDPKDIYFVQPRRRFFTTAVSFPVSPSWQPSLGFGGFAERTYRKGVDLE